MIHIDYETRSPINLITDGAHRYAERAEIICMGWAIDDGPVQMWKPLENELFPYELWAEIRSESELFAHNAEFESVISQHCLPFDIPPHLWTCTATMARACALPGGLEQLARCLGTTAQKDARGKDLIKLLCIPTKMVDGEPVYNEDPALLEEMYAYCAQDVETEREVGRLLRESTADEHDDYLTNLVINERGLPIDGELCRLSQQYAETEREELTEALTLASHGDLVKTSGTTLTQWVHKRLAPEHQKLMEKHKDGEKKLSLDKRARFELLAEPELDPDARVIIDLSDQASKSSVAKYGSMLRYSRGDGRARGSYLLSGAGQTGRFSAKGLQMHNLPRRTMPDPELVIEQMCSGESIATDEDNTMTVLSRMLRSAVCAPEGKWFVWSDLSQIEGRVLPWCSKYAGGEAKLQVFRDGTDIYKHTAAGMYNCLHSEVDDDQRFAGKVAELALGFAGGQGALRSMARNYNIDFTEDQANEIKDRWRSANAWAPPFWHGVEKAAMRAIRNPETMQPVGKVSYYYTPGALQDCLWCVLPSGRVLAYPGACIELVDGKFGKQPQITAIKGNLMPKRNETEWPRQRLWKGLLAENFTQAIAADILRGALRELVLVENAPVIGHTHDEVIIECGADPRTGEVEYWTEKLEAALTRVPSWATGLPLACDTKNGYRYGK